MVTGAQIRMGRASLRWSVAELAKAAKVGVSTVQRIEAVDGSPEVAGDLEWRTEARREAVQAVQTALERAGVTFLPDDGRAGPGIRYRSKGKR